MPLIHPSAIVEDGARVDPTSSVGPFSIVEAGAVIGADCMIESNVRVYGQTRMGRGNVVRHGATIGSAPQDLGYSPARARPLTIGNGNEFREYVNVSHGIKEDRGTQVGDENYLMAYSHVGHDCVVGDGNILANGATLAGHVELGSRNFLSGHVAVHQFCRIGDLVMAGGLSGIRQDVPPFMMVSGNSARYMGLNAVGLRRAGIGQQQRTAIKQAYRVLLRSGLPLAEAMTRLRAGAHDEAIAQILRFVESSTRGIVSAD